MEYDTIVLVTENKLSLLIQVMPYLISNLGANHIYLVANSSNYEKIEKITRKYAGRCSFINEESIFTGMSVDVVRNILEKRRTGSGRYAGWYLQQFIKMAYAEVSRREYYLIWDADTVPLHRLNYFDENNKPSFIIKREYHEQYFKTIDNIFHGKIKRIDPNISYIAENMMVRCEFMKEIIYGIMEDNTLHGISFFERILNAINSEDIEQSGFSEFETYGNYVDTVHSGFYNQVKLRSQRLGSFITGEKPSDEQLDWLANDYDVVSFEQQGATPLKKLSNIKTFRRMVSAKKAFDITSSLFHIPDRIKGQKWNIYDW